MRNTLAGWIGIIALTAVGLASMRVASELWAQTVFTLTLVAVLAAAVIALTHRSAAWRGAAVFGLGFFLVTFGPGSADTSPMLASNAVVDILIFQLSTGANEPPPAPLSAPRNDKQEKGDRPRNPVGDFNVRQENSRKIGQCAVVLLASLAGGLVGRAFAPAATPAAEPAPPKA